MDGMDDLANTVRKERRRFFKSSLALASIGALYDSLGILSKTALAQAHTSAHTSSTRRFKGRSMEMDYSK